jgi:hypothetical protein
VFRDSLNAGVWAISLARMGNQLNLTECEIAQLEPQILRGKMIMIERKVRHVGAHYVVESIAHLPAALDAIQARLRQAEQP